MAIKLFEKLGARFLSTDIGIDLGTASVLVFIKGRGIVLQEPSVVVVDRETEEIIKVGKEAQKMLGRVPENLEVVRPLREGVISKYNITLQMAQHFISRACGNMLIKPRVMICIPSGATEVDERAVIDAATQAGARQTYLVEEPVAAAIGGEITLTGLRRDTKQGDFRLFEIAERFGAGVRWDGNAVTITKAHKLTAHDIDASDIPDLIPGLSVMAALSEGTTRVYNGARLRIKESDRIASTAAMLTSLGADVRETEDGMIITGKKQLTGGAVKACNDHRIAMSAAAASAGCSGDITVDDIKCIDKSYPEFLRDFAKVKAN